MNFKALVKNKSDSIDEVELILKINFGVDLFSFASSL